MIRTIAWSSALVVALSGAAALADTDAVTAATPAMPAATGSPAPWAERSAAGALQRAYHAIAQAQALGATAYLDAAKTHYRDAIARYGRHDAGAAAEAMAAASLAMASVADHPAPAPHDLPAPPPMTGAPGAPPRRMAMDGMRGGSGGPPAGGAYGRRPMGAPGGMRPGGPHGRFDATRLAADARAVGTPEAKDLAQKALDADLARTRAAFSGNLEEAARQGMIATALARAVGSLARADHPPTAMRHGARGGWQRRGGSGAAAPGVVGETGIQNG